MGPERWWWSGLNLYLPQWLWGVPGLLILIASLRIAWRWAWAPLLCLVWVAGPLMGLCWGTEPPTSAVAGKSGLRLMSYNVKFGKRDLSAIMEEITRQKPDLLLLQDSNGLMNGEERRVLPLRHFLEDRDKENRSLRAVRQFVFASKIPYDRPHTPALVNSDAHTYYKTKVMVGSTVVTVYDVHLLTPRNGLTAVKTEAEEGISTFEDNVAVRLHEVRVLAELIRQEEGPVIVAGDFNAPDASMVVQIMKEAGLHDAFIEAGKGYGYTYGHDLRFRHSYMRIDHIFLSKHWRAVHCWTGTAEGSDHRPVIADLILR